MSRVDAVYARYSSHKQDDGTSIDVQLETCHRSAGGPCVDYIDRARTGRSIGGREQLLKLIADAEAGKIRRVFVYKFDRLGRAAETHVVVANLEECGVEVISATEGKEALARGVQLVVAEHYSKVLAERTRDGLLKRFEQRCWTGGPPPYGHQIVGGPDGRRRLAIHPEEAQVVRELFKSYLSEAVGLKELARRLEQRGVPTRLGAPWSFTTVRGILTNRLLVGEVTYGRRRFKLNQQTGRRIPKRNDAAKHCTYIDPALAIIEEADFLRVQEKLALRARPRGAVKASKGVRPFTGFLFCEACGSVYYARTSRNRKGEYHYYTCGCRQKRGPEACPNSASVREDKLMRKVTEVCTRIIDDADTIIEAAILEAEKRVSSHKEEASKLRQQMSELDRKSAALSGLLIDPEIDPAAKKAISRQMGELEGKREQLQQTMDRLVERAGEGTEKLAGAVREAFAEARESFAHITSPAQLNRFVEEYIGPMTVKADGTVVSRSAENTKASDSSEALVNSTIAGGGFEPPTSGL